MFARYPGMLVARALPKVSAVLAASPRSLLPPRAGRPNPITLQVDIRVRVATTPPAEFGRPPPRGSLPVGRRCEVIYQRESRRLPLSTRGSWNGVKTLPGDSDRFEARRSVRLLSRR